MRWIVLAVAAALMLFAAAPAAQAMTTERFTFVSNGQTLSGLLDTPDNGDAQALIIIIPGYGETDIANRTTYYDLRSRFTALGIATLIWDKPGCGQSEGVFDPNQPVESSAREVLDAIAALRVRGAPGSVRIGLWGISRAGWIAPLAIAQDPGIAFWISVSGTDATESFGYMLDSNFRIEGRTEQQIQSLMGEWRRGFEITRSGGAFADYLAATENLRADPFMIYLSGGAAPSEASFLADQEKFRSGAFQVDEASGLMRYVPDFEAVLMRAHIPVLALFGERDTSVDWRSTSALYARTIDQNPRARLTIRTFPDGNHNIQQSETGGLREMIEMQERRASAGYYEAMEEWLREYVVP